MDAPPQAIDATTDGPSAEDRGRFSRLEDLGAFAGGFGLVVVSWLSSEPITIVVAVLAGGVIFRGHILGAWMGFVTGAVALLILDSMLAEPPPAEYSGLGGFSSVVGVLVFAFVSAVGLMGYELSSVVAGGEWFARRGRVSGFLAAVAAVVGVVAIGAAIATWAVLLARPSSLSFELSLPAGWTSVEQPRFRDPAFGEQLTETFGSNQVPKPGESPEYPVVGVSVTRAGGPESECLRAFVGWPSVESILYDGAIQDFGPVNLPAGSAYREIRTPEPAGTVLYAYGFHRVRSIGLVREQLCYAVVITLPDNSPVSEDDADAIIRSFRLR